MRRTTTLPALTAVVALALAGCGGGSGSGGSDDEAGADICKSAQGSGPKIGLAYDVGGRGDQSFNDAAYAGLEKAVKEFDGQCTEGEASDGEPESAREDRLRQLAENGSNAIVAVGYAYADAVNAVSPDFPEVNFAVVDGDDTDSEKNANVAYLRFAEEQGSFLVGAAAAQTSKTGTIGFVGGVNIPLIQKFQAGYVAGAKAADPDVKVLVNYIQQSDLSGFGDAAGGKAAAAGQYDKNADVVFHVSGASGRGVFDAAVEAGDGKWAIGVDSDQYTSASAEQKPHILTSMLKRVDVATYEFVSSVDEGSPVTGEQRYDLKVNGVGYSTSGGFIDDLVPSLDEYKKQIVDGDIEVPTTP